MNYVDDETKGYVTKFPLTAIKGNKKVGDVLKNVRSMPEFDGR